VRVSRDIRAVGKRTGDTIEWAWIGTTTGASGSSATWTGSPNGRALGRWRVNSTNSSDEYCSLPQSEIRNQQISPQLFSLFTDPPDGFDSQLSTNCHAVDSRVGGSAIPADHGSLITAHAAFFFVTAFLATMASGNCTTWGTGSVPF
jgi:hypothetical protein